MAETNDRAMQLALELLCQEVLHIDAEGWIWRLADWKGPIEPRRAENIGGKGYLRLSLQDPIEKKLQIVAAHRVVWVWLYGEIPAGMQINHKDLNKQNNRPDNLELVTQEENIQHSYAVERANGNTRTPSWSIRGRTGIWSGRKGLEARPVLTEDEVTGILEARKAGLRVVDIAARFGTSVRNVYKLCSERLVEKGGQ